MNILIAGCSSAGAKLAGELCREGHDVSVVDPYESAQSLLPDDYTGYFTTGLLIDEDVLKNAGIENCDALAAVSEDDSVNIMVAQLAQTVFGIKRVVASLQDPFREEKFKSLIPTICPTNISVSSLRGCLLREETGRVTFGSATMDIRLMPVPEHLIGVRASEIGARKGESVIGVYRPGTGLTLTADDRVNLCKDDCLVVARIVD